MPKRGQYLRFVPLLAWGGVIAATSSRFIDRDAFIRFVSRYLPSTSVQGYWATFWLYCGIFLVKGWHVTEFAFIYCLVHFALRTGLGLPASKTRVWSFVVSLLFAASDEWHQTFVPGRGGTIIDVGIDLIGITLAAIILYQRDKRNLKG